LGRRIDHILGILRRGTIRNNVGGRNAGLPGEIQKLRFQAGKFLCLGSFKAGRNRTGRFKAVRCAGLLSGNTRLSYEGIEMRWKKKKEAANKRTSRKYSAGEIDTAVRSSVSRRRDSWFGPETRRKSKGARAFIRGDRNRICSLSMKSLDAEKGHVQAEKK